MNNMVKLSVNINKIATLRNSRGGNNPDLLKMANDIQSFGAHGITIHPRPDQRHIRASDCHDLAAALKVEFNIEGNPFAPAAASDRSAVGDYPGFMSLVEATRPAQVTLVPDGDAQLTSDHGFDLRQDSERLLPIITQLKSWGCRVGVFMDPDPAQMAMAAAPREAGVHRYQYL